MYKGKVAVRKIVEFILRRGDIDSRKVSNHTAQEGARIHRQLQKEAGDAYQKEVFFKRESQIEKDSITVEGRADGLFFDAAVNSWVIDEIKTSEPAFEDIPEDQIDLFFAQGMVYAYLFLLQENEQAALNDSEKQEKPEAEAEATADGENDPRRPIDRIAVQLTYYQTTEKLTTRTRRTFQFSELAVFYEELLQEYHKWLVFQENWRRVRNTSLQLLSFPFETFRKGQRELAAAAYKTLKNGKRLFAEAPTGTGKTMSTLFPALKVLGEEGADRVFYLTAKTITRQVAEDALSKLADNGSETKSVTITAKDKICFLDERNCTPEHCPYAQGYYNRINEALWDLLHHENQITREVIETYGMKHTVCPFELSLDVSVFCDVIIGDYNYLFDPTVYLRRFFEEPDEEYFFLVDEAHNLVNRSKEMYSSTILRQPFKELKKKLPKDQQKLKRALNRVDKEFAALAQLAKEEGWSYHHQAAPHETMVNQLYKLAELMKEWLPANPEHELQEEVLQVYFEANHYLKISEFYDDHYETTVEIDRYDIKLRQFCIEPAPFLESVLDKGKASLLFSASFTPLSYYQEVLGGGDEALRYRLPSPFDPKNQGIFIADYIQTTYRQREASIPAIVDAIQQMTAAKAGNYMVFFPSYRYLDDVAAAFSQQAPEVEVLIQGTAMNEAEREAFLAQFQSFDSQQSSLLDKSQDEPKSQPKTLMAFCVLGGIFSEGIDLKGDRLIGAAVVGVGLPQINHEQELIREYYDEKKAAGFAYAYQLPGMNKVLQAAGRVIRDVSDRGVVLLLDQRFRTPRYQELFPLHWQHALQIRRPQELSKALTHFWQEKN
ncbi:ATP-dependent DNA helicase [Enterococcus casseliflavus]|uniref:ATP-dependent DNA helicase n=1 Tax=Enterococcus casseliflavus TaxID=37734 RepID=UPI0039A4303D